jgi:hypothetical protein
MYLYKLYFDQYEVERCTLADSNLNVPCELGIRYLSLVAMHNRHLMTLHITVIYTHKYVHTAIDIVCTVMYLYVLVRNSRILDIVCNLQANSKQSTGCVRLDINLLKPSRIELQGQDPAPTMALHYGHPSSSSPDLLEYVYLTGHPVLPWLPTKLAEWIGKNLQEPLGFPDKAARRARPGTGWTPGNWIIFCRHM